MQIDAATLLSNPGGDDRAELYALPGGWGLVVADGAGGVAGGATAAQSVVDAVRGALDGLRSSAEVAGLLQSIDHRLAGENTGETTAVVVLLSQGKIWGASVGDSRAIVVRSDGCEELTFAQFRKPLLGSGGARPVAFDASAADGNVLVCGTDGLFNYAGLEPICARARAARILALPSALLDLVRLPSGSYPDDVGVIVARISVPPPHGPGRQRA